MPKLLKKLESLNYLATRSLADYINDDQEKLHNRLRSMATLATSTLKQCERKNKDNHKSR